MPRRLAAALAVVILMTISPMSLLPSVAQEPDAQAAAIAPAADPTVVDELSGGFSVNGPGWHDGIGGYDGHHYWTAAVHGRTVSAGTWRATLPLSGSYRVEAMMPARHATTRAARYVIGTAVGAVARGVDQSRARGSWLSLGTFELGTEVAVRLSARTGDPAGSRRLVAFDALRFVPLESPPPPVISDIDVVAQHDRAIVRFSLDARGPARTEYRLAGAIDWRPGSEETGSQYADHRQVIDGLRPLTDYELRIVASNAGGRTVSDLVRFSTTAVPAPVIRDIEVAPSETSAVVRFGLDERGPARSEYRAAGASDWRLGAEEQGSQYANHRMVIDGLRPETRYELRIVAWNGGGTTTSDVVPFRTDLRTVDCSAGEDLPAAIDAARAGDTLRIRGSCSGSGITFGKDLTLKGISADAGVFLRFGVGDASVAFVDLRVQAYDSLTNRGRVVLDGVNFSVLHLNNEAYATLTLRSTTLHSYHEMDNRGTVTALDSGINLPSGMGSPCAKNHAGASMTLTDTRLSGYLCNEGAAVLRGVTMSNVGPNSYFCPTPIRNSAVLTIEGSRFTDNSPSYGAGSCGAGVLFNLGRATISDSVFLRNQGGQGAIVNTGSITLTNVTFRDNVPADCVGCQ